MNEPTVTATQIVLQKEIAERYITEAARRALSEFKSNTGISIASVTVPMMKRNTIASEYKEYVVCGVECDIAL